MNPAPTLCFLASSFQLWEKEAVRAPALSGARQGATLFAGLLPPCDSPGKGQAEAASFRVELGPSWFEGLINPGLRKERGQYCPLSAHISLWSAQVQAHADPGEC